MGLSIRAYAASRKERGLPGGSHTAVRKAIATGRITALPDGTIDPEQADREWGAQTDPSKQRGEHAQAIQRATAAETASAPPATKPVPRAAIDAVNSTLEEEGEDGTEAAPGKGGETTFLRARMANEVLKAQTQRVRLQKMKGEVVDRARATALVFDLARRERDAWLNWPARVAANMAADLGVEPHAMEQVLDRYLREHLADLAEVKLELR